MTRTRTLQRGHKAIAPIVQITDLQELTRADLAVLAEKRPPNRLKNLRDTHHRVARAIASGLRDAEVCELCGISSSRLTTLKPDPAFAELVAHYRAIATAEWASHVDPVVDYLKSNALKAQRQISDKLDEAEELGKTLPTRELLGIAELGLDRTSYGKVNKNLNVNIDFAAHLEAARNRAAAARAIGTGPITIDDSVVPSPSLAPPDIRHPPAEGRVEPAPHRVASRR